MRRDVRKLCTGVPALLMMRICFLRRTGGRDYVGIPMGFG